jgi:hypothetical protein
MPACWVLPGLDNVSCLSGPVRLLRLVARVISRSLPPVSCAAIISRQKAAACLAIYVPVPVLPVIVPACIAATSVTHASHRAQALTLAFG